MTFDFLLHNPLPDDKILDWSKLKKIADDILTLSSANANKFFLTHYQTTKFLIGPN